MYLRTVLDKGSPTVIVKSVFITESDKTFVLLYRSIPYHGRDPWFLAEMTEDSVAKRLPDGGTELFRKMLVDQTLSREDIRFIRDQKPGHCVLPWLGMKKLKSLAGGGTLTFLPEDAWGQLIDDTVFKFVSASVIPKKWHRLA